MGFHQRPMVVGATLCVALIFFMAGAALAEDFTIRAVDQPVAQVFPQGQHFPTYDPSDGSTKAIGDTTLGVVAQVDPFEGSGPDITAPGAAVTPTIDGVVSPGEWTDALAIDVSVVTNPVMMYLKHDGNYLYVAFVDENDPTNDVFDQVGIYFDDEGGASPILYDDLWTASACPADEGNFWLGNLAPDPDDQFRGWIAGPSACTVQLGGTNVQIAYSVSGGFMNYEAAIDLAASAIQAVQGETFGYRIYVADSTGSFNGYFPANSVFNDPSTYANLTLGFLGDFEPLVCNGTPVSFEAGDFLPDDWSMTSNSDPGGEWLVSTDNSSSFWTIPPTPTGARYASANDDAGGSGSDGSVDYLYSNIIDLSTASAASMDFQYFFDGQYGQIAGGVEVSPDGGATWDGEVIVPTNPGWELYTLDMSGYAGNDNVQVRFHADDGGAWASGYAVDDIYLSCTQPAITMVKTVGTEAGVCATTDTIVVPPGTDVHYCYTVTNTGNVALTVHNLEDDQLGTLLLDTPFNLEPGLSGEVLVGPVTINTTTVNVATWMAYNPDPVEADEAEATDDATVVVLANDTCDDAIELTCPEGGGTFSVMGSTLLASYTGPFDCDTTHTAPELWYKIMGNGGGITASTCSANTNYDTKLSSFDGTCGALGCVIGDDDDSSCSFSGLQTTINWTSVLGTENYIMVHGYSSGVGDFELTITCDIPVELQSFTIE